VICGVLEKSRSNYKAAINEMERKNYLSAINTFSNVWSYVKKKYKLK